MDPNGDKQIPDPQNKAPEPPPMPPLPSGQNAAPPRQQPFPPPPAISSTERKRQIILSLVVPNLVALLLLWITSLILNADTNSRSGTYIMAEFVIIPFLMGICAAFCLRHTGTGIGANLAISLANTAIGIGLSYLILRE